MIRFIIQTLKNGSALRDGERHLWRVSGRLKRVLWVLLAVSFSVLIVFTLIATAIFVKGPPQIHGLYCTYYPNTNWQEPAWKKEILVPAVSDSTPDFWRAQSYLKNRFSAEWRGYVDIQEPGTYTFFTNSDDGSWLYIDDNLIVDNGGFHGKQERQGTIYLTRRIHKISIRYYQGGGSAALDVAWMKEGQTKTSIPEASLFPPGTRLTYFGVANQGVPWLINGWGILGFIGFFGYMCPGLRKHRFPAKSWQFGKALSNRSQFALLSLVWFGGLGSVLFVLFMLSRVDELHGLYASYYANSNWQGKPWKKDTLDTKISGENPNFWKANADFDRFSVEWKGNLDISQAGEYTFFITSTGATWLFLDHGLVVDNAGTQAARTAQGTVRLDKGLHNLIIRYAQNRGPAQLAITWAQKDAVPTTLSDEVLYTPVKTYPLVPITTFFLVGWGLLCLYFIAKNKQSHPEKKILDGASENFSGSQLLGKNFSNLQIFISIAVIYSSIYLALLVQHKIPLAHDTFQSFHLQYVYYNEFIQYHAIPRWVPFFNMGGANNYYFTIPFHSLTPLYYLVGVFFKQINYVYLFYGFLWFAEMVFLLGSILLASLYYKERKAVFFVAFLLMGTNIWQPQIWWNFILYYFLPLVLYCLHQWLNTRRFRYFLSLLLFFPMLSVFGDFPYAVVFTSFVFLLYLGCLLFCKIRYWGQIKISFQTQLTALNMIVLCVVVFLIVTSFSYVFYGFDQMHYAQETRDTESHVTLKTFLTYGGSIGVQKYTEFFSRYGDSLNINLYAGFLLVPLVLLALFYEKRRIAFVVGGVALAIFLFSVGSFVAYLFYYFYPGGKVFRHIGLTAPVFKLFIIFYAGFGFEQFLKGYSTDRKVIILIEIFLIGLLFLFQPSLGDDLDWFWWIEQEHATIYLLFALYIVILFMSCVLFLFWFIIEKTQKREKYFITILASLFILDIFSYKYSLIVCRMPSVPKEVFNLFRPYTYEFPWQRRHFTALHAEENPRMADLPKFLHAAIYDTTEWFFYTDTIESRYRVDWMMKPIYEYLEIWKRFPNKQFPVYEKYAGQDYPKLGVFSTLHVVSDFSRIGEIFSYPEFTGDMLFSTATSIESLKKEIPMQNIIPLTFDTPFINRNDRVAADIIVKGFSFNTLRLQVSVSKPPEQNYFLYYADAYHPHWKAFVNGKQTPVIRANVGFKAVVIPAGQSEVVFEFGNIFYSLPIYCTMILLLMTFGGILVIFLRTMKKL